MNASPALVDVAALAPVALFAFRRPDHTQRTLEALASNPSLRDSPLIVFCDGARSAGEQAQVEATRAVVHAFDHPRKVVHASPANLGLARSIIKGVGALCEQYGRVIVVEDDLVVAPTFLEYMNRGLARYASAPRVMQISGHMFPVGLEPREGSLFLPFTTTWGWATWSRAWRAFDATASGAARLAGSWRERFRFDLDGSYPYFSMLQRQLAGEVDSWGIRWYLSTFLSGGLTLYPRSSLVSNIGFDGSGTHCGTEARQTLSTVPLSIDVNAGEPAVDEDAYRRIKRHLRAERGWVGSLKDWKGRLTASPLIAHGS